MWNHFQNIDGTQEECPKCRSGADNAQPVNEQESSKSHLRLLKNTLRDAQVKGEMLNTSELSARTEIPEPRIWHFINSGEIDTTSMNDPKVREFIKRKRVELAREAARTKQDRTPEKSEEPARKTSGFHLKDKDDRRR